MSDDAVIYHCAPTLAGMKTASLFSCEYKEKESLLADIRRINKILVPKGLCMLPLQFLEKRALLYLYRPSCLLKDLNRQEVLDLLTSFGYSGKSCGQALGTLIRRLKKSPEFPHEIGLFLGYPPEDVRGFIENKAGKYKLLGYWKVYGDAKKAEKLFKQYKTCTKQYCNWRSAGRDLGSLAVAG